VPGNGANYCLGRGNHLRRPVNQRFKCG